MEDSNPSCLNKQKRYLEERGHDHYAEDLWIPDCDEDGFYRAKQRKKKKSICVAQSGKKLFGQDEADLSENMTCGCSRHMDDLLRTNGEDFMTKPQEHCTTNGNFDNLQCVRNLCYCADTVTGEVTGRIVLMKYRNKLPCYNKVRHAGSYTRKCEQELQRTRSLRYQFRRKGIDVLGLEWFHCDMDGSFSPLQCDTAGCACTDETGAEIRSYHTDNQNAGRYMTCNCARDVESTFVHAQYPAFNCDQWGNYRHFQCLNTGQCFCVDEDGDVITKELSRGTPDELFCQKLAKYLLEYELEDPETTRSTQTTDDETDYDY